VSSAATHAVQETHHIYPAMAMDDYMHPFLFTDSLGFTVQSSPRKSKCFCVRHIKTCEVQINGKLHKDMSRGIKQLQLWHRINKSPSTLLRFSLVGLGFCEIVKIDANFLL